MIVLVDEAGVRETLTWEALLASLERAFIDLSRGLVQQPVRTVLAIPQHEARFGMMPAVYGSFLGVKLVAVYPGNAGRGLPTHQAMIHLFDAGTGEPLAVMDGRLITEMRTAAVSAIATRLLASRDARTLAILGSGIQARAHLTALRLVRHFEKVRVWSRSPANAERFAGETGARSMPAEEAVRDADVVVTVTNSPEPILRGEWLKPRVHINAVGAVGNTRRELDAEAMQGIVVVESREAAAVESGDILLSGVPVYAELGELLHGKSPIPSGKRTIFKSLGVAVADVVAASLVYRALTQ